MPYIAITSGDRVLEITTTEQASIDAMQAYSRLGYPALRRFLATAASHIAYSHGTELATDFELDVDGKPRTVIVPRDR